MCLDIPEDIKSRINKQTIEFINNMAECKDRDVMLTNLRLINRIIYCITECTYKNSNFNYDNLDDNELAFCAFKSYLNNTKPKLTPAYDLLAFTVWLIDSLSPYKEGELTESMADEFNSILKRIYTDNVFSRFLTNLDFRKTIEEYDIIQESIDYAFNIQSVYVLICIFVNMFRFIHL